MYSLLCERVMDSYAKYCYAERFKQCVVEITITKLSMAIGYADSVYAECNYADCGDAELGMIMLC
jgi:hypothetical protein